MLPVERKSNKKSLEIWVTLTTATSPIPAIDIPPKAAPKSGGVTLLSPTSFIIKSAAVFAVEIVTTLQFVYLVILR